MPETTTYTFTVAITYAHPPGAPPPEIDVREKINLSVSPIPTAQGDALIEEAHITPTIDTYRQLRDSRRRGQ